MKIVIRIPFEQAERLAAVWAVSEETVDFDRPGWEAARCTLSFAATELSRYLPRLLKDAEVSFAGPGDKRPCDLCIELSALNEQSRADGYTIWREKGCLRIVGAGRTGTLFGVYAFLRAQGVAWYEPGDKGEVLPPVREELQLDFPSQEQRPAFSLRGFDFEGELKESCDLWLWMARNGLNLCAWRPNTGKFQQKLGLTFKAGGHIFESILDPERMMPSGKCLFDEHPDWYGRPESGEPVRERALSVQFCVTNEGLLDFLAGEVIQRLNDRWKHADLLDVWGFDTWGSTCQCERCQALGNGSDQALYFVSALRQRLDRALEVGRLSHPVRLVLCAYEGTATLKPPLGSIPENLQKTGDLVAFYPIKRCYAHRFSDPSCPRNRDYFSALRGWLLREDALPVIFGEYYNVSKYEDLPALFPQVMAQDLEEYCKIGVSGMTYMHLPMVNWGLRALTQGLYALYGRMVQADAAYFLDAYFSGFYGTHAQKMRRVAALCEEAYRLIASFRSWGEESVLSQLLFWDGTPPKVPFLADSHFRDAEAIVAEGYASVEKQEKALAIVKDCLSSEREDVAKGRASRGGAPVNPYEMGFWNRSSRMEARLSEAKRQLLYGVDMMRILTQFVEYYQALYDQDFEFAGEVFDGIERSVEKMEGYAVPMRFYDPAGYACDDAYTRSQLRGLYYCAKKWRMEHTQ